MKKQTSARRVLFSRGASSYFDAMMAIQAFQQEVQSICRDVCKPYDRRLIKRMNLTGDRWQDHDFSDGSSVETLGIMRPDKDGHDFYVYLKWFDSEAGKSKREFAGFVELEFYRKGERDEIFKRFANRRHSLEKYDYESSYSVCLWKSLDTSRPGNARGVLKSLIT